MKFELGRIKKMFDDIIFHNKTIDDSEEVLKDIDLEKTIDDKKVKPFNTNDLINGLLNSDYSSVNMCYLLNEIYVLSKPMYERIINIVSSKIVSSNNKLIYIGRQFDIYKSIAIVNILKSSNVNELNNGYFDNLIFDTVNGKDGYDLEFEYYYSFLEKKINEPNLERLNDVLLAFRHCYNVGSKDNTIDNMRKFIMLIVDWKTKVITTKDSSCVLFKDTLEINLNENAEDRVIFHEIGHAIDIIIKSYRDRKHRPVELLERAKKNILSNPISYKAICDANRKISELEKQIDRYLLDDLKNEYHLKSDIDNIERYIDDIEKQVKQTKKIEELLEEYKISGKLSQSIMEHLNSGEINTRLIAENIFSGIKKNIIKKCTNNLMESSFLGIIDSVFGGSQIVFEEYGSVKLKRFHYKDYFDSSADSNIKEMYADFNTLLVHGRTDMLETIKDMIGEELFNFVMSEHDIDRINEEYDKKKGDAMIK